MAKIATSHQPAIVTAMGAEMKATATVSGALMEMLSTVYKFVMMAGIRESIQNGCDAARRAGLSFAEGVQVLLPTAANPMVTIIDFGAGMTKAFMEAEDGYLSFGVSTKRGDNGAAGGLGVGRWAAYGYIRECYITTTHASDMIERTFFQYQNEGGEPAVRLASEVPGTRVGTRVCFPVKESDVSEAYRAVAWLKEVMQLTMEDSFTVDSPALLPTVLPPYSRVPLDLGEFDPGLKGVVVHAMQGEKLQYNRQGLQQGSLVVLTNHEAGVGGLPFHVQSPTDAYSVFHMGMVIDIPMSFAVPFMPSREELKYTDDVNTLLRRIDAAAAKAMLAKAESLYLSPDLESQAALSRFLGVSNNWHWFTSAVRDTKCPQFAAMERATGGKMWGGRVKLNCPPDIEANDVRLRFWDSATATLREARPSRIGGGVLTKIYGSKDWEILMFNPALPYVLAVNDVERHGQTRFRRWASGQKGGFLFFTAKTPRAAVEAMERVNAFYGHGLPVVRVSSMPDVERTVSGRKVVRTSNKGTLAYYSVDENKQTSLFMSLTEMGEPVRLWLEKDGGRISGFEAGATLGSLQNRYAGDLDDVLKAADVSRLYLLTPKQAEELRASQAEMADTDLNELEELAADGDADALASLANAKALATWKTFDSAIEEFMVHPAVANIGLGKDAMKLTPDALLLGLCKALARTPRMELTGTQFDRAISPYVDVLSGTVHMIEKVNTQQVRLQEGLQLIGTHLKVEDTDPEDRKEMKRILSGLLDAGHVNYRTAMEGLKERFPLLKLMQLNVISEDAVKDLSQALSILYR